MHGANLGTFCEVGDIDKELLIDSAGTGEFGWQLRVIVGRHDRKHLAAMFLHPGEQGSDHGEGDPGIGLRA